MDYNVTYEEFINSKRHSGIDAGIEPVFFPEMLFDYQKHVAAKTIKKGRYADFLDTGTGKTGIELTVAHNYVLSTNKPVLIITPLSVAFQFVGEAEKFGIPDVEYSKDGKFSKKIIICNYERLHYFSPSDFDCVILDESSILKNFEGAIKNHVTSFLKKVKYRFLFSATPSPNDYIELGTSSEAIGELGYIDMLNRFFKNNKSTVKLGQVDKARQGMEWYLKPYAEKDFWLWVSSWSISMRKPSDIGFSDERHILPALIENNYVVKNSKFNTNYSGQGMLFNLPANNFFEIKKEVRATVNERCEAAVSKANDHDISVYWVNLNDESSLIKSLDKSSYEIRGSMDADEKEEILIAFSKGEIKKLITKTSITAFGLNWQHCNHSTYFPTFSYEQYYQAVRRFWRFGQKKEVIIDRILSDGQSKIMDSLNAKQQKAISMFENLVTLSNNPFLIQKKQFDKNINLPSFVK